MEETTLTEKLDYFFSAFCVDFFETTRTSVEKYNYAIPIVNLKEVLINFEATNDELLTAAQESEYLRVNDGKLIIPFSDDPYRLSVLVTAFPKCIPSYRFRELIQQVLGFKAYVYDYILAHAADLMSFVVTFEEEEHKRVFCEFFKHASYELISRQEFNRFHAKMKQLRLLYKDMDHKEALPSLISELDAVKKYAFWTEIGDEVKKMHADGMKEFVEVKEYRRKNHVKNFWEKQREQTTEQEVKTRPKAELSKSIEVPIKKTKKSRFAK